MNKECEYCSEDNTESGLSGDDGIIIDKYINEAYIFAEHFRDECVRITKINYCPRCGKQLNREGYR